MNVNYSIEEIKRSYENQYDDIIDEYFDFLIVNEFGFWCTKEQTNHFPKMDLAWQSPLEITNAILDFDVNSNYNLYTIAQDLTFLGCNGLEIRIYHKVDISYIRTIVKYFQDTRLKNILIFVKYNELYDEMLIDDLCADFRIIKHVILHSAPEEKYVELKKTFSKLHYAVNKLDSADCCGQIEPYYFRVNLELFTESLQFNSCLNRKISVDSDGYIKNCPSSKTAFGQIQLGARLLDVVHQAQFRSLWSINKDQIAICKDCEFRYICTDCRVFLQEPNNLYSKPLKCKYNPYQAIWEESFF
jgi:SPASM domain peptide maturase of grasp-with-spasm system